MPGLLPGALFHAMDGDGICQPLAGARLAPCVDSITTLNDILHPWNLP